MADTLIEDMETAVRVGRYVVARYRKSRFWAVIDEAGALVCLTVYKKGAQAVASLLSAQSV